MIIVNLKAQDWTSAPQVISLFAQLSAEKFDHVINKATARSSVTPCHVTFGSLLNFISIVTITKHESIKLIAVLLLFSNIKKIYK